MSEPTPTPWKHSAFATGGTILGPKEFNPEHRAPSEVIFRYDVKESGLYSAYSRDTGRANAELVTRLVNSYEELQEILQSLTPWIESRCPSGDRWAQVAIRRALTLLTGDPQR